MTSTGFIRNKAELVRRAVEHRKAGRIWQGAYGFLDIIRGRARVKVCAVGCLATPLTRAEDAERWGSRRFQVFGHAAYRTLEEDFGIPHDLAMQADHIFEGLPERLAKSWPEEFARALPRRKIRPSELNRFDAWLDDHNKKQGRRALLKYLRTGALPEGA